MLIITPNNKIYHVEPNVGTNTDDTVKVCIGTSSQNYDLIQLRNIIGILNKAKKELEEGYNAIPHFRRENSDGTI